MKQVSHRVDFCIIGGGMSGVCAAVAAARHGTKVLLMQDRPVLGGNASSEIRMWVCGAHGDNNRETGILEEIQLENLYRNNTPNYQIWDSVLYEKVRFQENITLLLNCTCIDAEMDGNKIKSVKGWQLTNETFHTIEADYFADCSGDSVLAPLTGADFRIGREARAEFDESIEPETADKKTMGMSCLLQIRETDKPQKFIPPSWANKYEKEEDLPPQRWHDIHTNFWWIELGGEQDSIHDTEELKDELLKITFGIWDHMKNHGDHGVENWVLDWIGFLPGKRESRRYMGDYIMTQNDVRSEGKFEDLVAYGGWSMDDHHPAGFYYLGGYPTIFHEAPSPFGIPYRCLYSRNIENLYFAGRNISTTHAALSATRVMGTCSVIGQAMGTAAAIAVKNKLSPREVYEKEIDTLRQTLMEDDCYLPFTFRKIGELTAKAKLSATAGEAENLRNGYDRPIGENDNGWWGDTSDSVTYSFEQAVQMNECRIVFDSDLNRNLPNMPCAYRLGDDSYHVPVTLVKDFKLILPDENDAVSEITVENNHQRFVKVPLNGKAKSVRFVPLSTWGAEKVHVFSLDIQ
ncbi:MAG: hypothetical protein BGN88_13950 [Clostridiales bacterium 43-6]|nr:MAG: hypothetical protein BGN88_13950 [Clostridiales bacterium 43-6]